jgi:hypothetical protein
MLEPLASEPYSFAFIITIRASDGHEYFGASTICGPGRQNARFTRYADH